MAYDYIERLLRPRPVVFLLGPRGTGKTTWVRHELPGVHRIDLLDEGLFQSYLARPTQFADELRTVPAESTVVVDEVQRPQASRMRSSMPCARSRYEVLLSYASLRSRPVRGPSGVRPLEGPLPVYDGPWRSQVSAFPERPSLLRGVRDWNRPLAGLPLLAVEPRAGSPRGRSGARVP
jgi:hypothetical protein